MDQKEIDAVIVDFINYTASLKCIDLALYTCDLRVAEKSKYFDYRNLKETDKQVAISLPKGSLKLYFPIALDSIIRSSHMNELRKVTTSSQADIEIILNGFMAFFEKECW